MKRILISLFVLLLCGLAFALTPPTLAWDPNPPDENVIAYEVCVHSSEPIPNLDACDYGVFPAGDVLEFTIPSTLAFAAPNLYYFGVRAMNIAGLKSEWGTRDENDVVAVMDLSKFPSEVGGVRIQITWDAATGLITVRLPR